MPVRADTLEPMPDGRRLLRLDTQRQDARLSVAAGLMRGRSTGQWLVLVVALFALFWLTALVSTSISPPADNIEQMLWVQSLQWGYYKHPPLPTWLYWIPAKLFGAHAWTTYLAGALVNLASIALFWHLLRQLRGPRFGYIAVLAALCITYYNVRFTNYNHNTVLMLVSTASAALCWQACTTGRLRWWLGLGIALGLGMLTKYQIAIAMTSVMAFWLHQRGWKVVAQRRGLLLAILIASVMFVPHVMWLREHDFGPVTYAIDSSLVAGLSMPERIVDVLNWLADQLLNRALPAWLLLICVATLKRRANRVDGGGESGSLPARSSKPANLQRDDARALILIWGLVPLGFVSLVGLSAGSRLILPWGTPHLLFAVPAAMELFRSRVRWRAISIRHVTAVFMAIQAALILFNVGTSVLGPAILRNQHWRSFDSAAMARQLEPALRKALAGRQLAAIAGPEVLAASLAHELPEKPVVLIDGRLDRSPWVNAAMLASGPTLQLQLGMPLPDGATVGADYPDTWWRLSWPPRLVSAIAGNTTDGVADPKKESQP